MVKKGKRSKSRSRSSSGSPERKSSSRSASEEELQKKDARRLSNAKKQQKFRDELMKKIAARKAKVAEKSPKASPKRSKSPKASPKRSKSPKASPKKSSKKSPKASPKRSPSRSPSRSPTKERKFREELLKRIAARKAEAAEKSPKKSPKATSKKSPKGSPTKQQKFREEMLKKIAAKKSAKKRSKSKSRSRSSTGSKSSTSGGYEFSDKCWKSTGRMCADDEYCSFKSGDCESSVDKNAYVLKVGNNKIVGKKSELEKLQETVFRGKDSTVSRLHKKSVSIRQTGEIEIPEDVLETPAVKERVERKGVSKSQEKRLSEQASKQTEDIRQMIKDCLNIL